MMDAVFKGMTYSARYLYACLMMESGGKRDFKFPKKSATKYGFNWGTAWKCLNELIEKGFIEKKSSGKIVREPNEYRFVTNWKQR